MGKPKLDLEKKTMNFFRGDFEKIADMYPALEPSTVVRELLHQHIEAIEAKAPAPRAVKVDM